MKYHIESTHSTERHGNDFSKINSDQTRGSRKLILLHNINISIDDVLWIKLSTLKQVPEGFPSMVQINWGVHITANMNRQKLPRILCSLHFL